MDTKKSGILFLGEEINLLGSETSILGVPRFENQYTWARNLTPDQIFSELRDLDFSSVALILEQSQTEMWETSSLARGPQVPLIPGKDLESLIHQTRREGNDFLHYHCVENSTDHCFLSSVDKSMVQPWIEAGKNSEVPVAFVEFLDLILIRILSEVFVRGAIGFFALGSSLIRCQVSPDLPFKITKVYCKSGIDPQSNWEEPALLISVLKDDEAYQDFDIPLVLSDDLCRHEIIEALGEVWPGNIFRFSQVFGTESEEGDTRAHLSNLLVRFPEYELWVSFSPKTLVKMAMSIVALGWLISLSLPADVHRFLRLSPSDIAGAELVVDQSNSDLSSLENLLAEIKVLREN